MLKQRERERERERERDLDKCVATKIKYITENLDEITHN